MRIAELEGPPYTHRMVATKIPHCQKCSRRYVIFKVEPEEAIKAVVLHRWRE